jgi:pSer/pThr/pTyr-binding forkhead associated (FHA) protein
MAVLSLLGEDGAQVQRWEIGERPIAVGRDDSADVTIPDDALSRRHFMIWREGDTFVIKDLDSQNGTWVDGQRAQDTKLRQNDCILAGRTLFLFSQHLPGAARAAGDLAPTHDTAFLPAILAAERAARPANQNPQLERSS